MALEFPPLNGVLVNSDGTPSIAFQVWWQQFRDTLTATVEGLVEVNEQQQEAIEAIQAAQDAADAANAAAAAADASAIAAQAQADAAAAAAGQANDLISDIEAGNLDLSAVQVNGVRFVNNGGVLEPEVP